MGAILDRALGTSAAIFCTASAAYFVANEGVSILENVVLMGVPVPSAIRKALEMVGEEGGYRG